MLRLLSGRTHEVVTGVCLVAGRARASPASSAPSVRFATLTPRPRSPGTWRTGEPLDKAGAYHVDGAGAASSSRSKARRPTWPACPVRLVLSLAKQLGVDLGLP